MSYNENKIDKFNKTDIKRKIMIIHWDGWVPYKGYELEYTLV